MHGAHSVLDSYPMYGNAPSVNQPSIVVYGRPQSIAWAARLVMTVTSAVFTASGAAAQLCVDIIQFVDFAYFASNATFSWYLSFR